MNRRLPTTAFGLVLGLSVAMAATADSRAQRYEVQTPFSSIKAGGARVRVRAPMDVVRSVVTDFGAYSQNIKRFEKVRVVGRRGKATDVYLQVPIMKGAAKVWAIVRFEPVKQGPGGEEVVVGKLLRGNVKRLDALWRISKIDEQNTRLDLELLIVPDLGLLVPRSLVTGEVAYAAECAVKGMRKRAEQLSPR